LDAFSVCLPRAIGVHEGIEINSHEHLGYLSSDLADVLNENTASEWIFDNLKLSFDEAARCI
jgi:hypothetical protein